MKVRVNLLPAAYLRVRQHHHRFRVGAMIWLVLLAGEVTAGLLLNARANYTRELFTAAEAAREATLSTRQAMEEPRLHAEQLSKQVELAEKLRTKHRWSRLLAALGNATPERVLITSVQTNPPQWAPGTYLAAVQAAADSKDRTRMMPPLLTGITITGYAVDHQDLSAFMAAVHGSGLFASMDLRQARRERFLDSEAIRFTMDCHW